MNKRKVLMLALSLCMVAILAVGGTLAYFIDTDTATNVFTIGNVEIELVEEFEQNSQLMPGAWDRNQVEKVVTVKNTGDNDAYMWIELWIPAELDVPGNAGNNSLHFNPFDTYEIEGKVTPMKGSAAEEAGATLVAETVEVYLGEKEIGGKTYHGYREYIKDDSAKASGESTYALLAQVYMDSRVTQCTAHENCLKLVDGNCYTGAWEIIVNAFGIQAEGIDSIEDAINAYNAQVKY